VVTSRSTRRLSPLPPAEASTAQTRKVSPVSRVAGVKVTSTPLALPVAVTVGAPGWPTEMVLLGEDSAPAPLSFTVRALQGGRAGR